jgi:copper chaperone CopZ
MAALTSQGRAGAMRSAELAIGGMTCASCAARIEKKLNRLDGVAATVNFATETARVSFPAWVSTGNLISVVEQAGYTAALPAPRQVGPAGPGAAAGASAAGEAGTMRRLLVSLALVCRQVCGRFAEHNVVALPRQAWSCCRESYGRFGRHRDQMGAAARSHRP